MLEAMLKEKGADPPPIVYPPKTTRGTLYPDGDDSPPRTQPQATSGLEPNTTAVDDTSPQSFHDEIADGASHAGSYMSLDQRERTDQDNAQGTPIDNKKEGILSRLLSNRGHLSFDQISGRLRYYGPTVNSHIYSEVRIST